MPKRRKRKSTVNKSGNYTKLYVNGITSDSTNLPSQAYTDNDASIVMGGVFDSGSETINFLDEVRFWARALNSDEKESIMGQPETFLFKKDEEKHLFNKINEIRKYFSSTKRQESYDETLKILAEAKPTTDNFFDNVIVNDENSDVKKNRLELLQMFCKTYNNFIDFSKVEGI